MGFKYSSTGIKDTVFEPLPEGDYVLRVASAVPGTTKSNDDPKVTVDYVIAAGNYANREIRYHNVVFFKDKTSPGAGMAIHYLKCLGEPYDGDFDVNPEHWIGKLIRAKVVNQTLNKKTYPGIKYVKPLEESNNGNLEDMPF